MRNLLVYAIIGTLTISCGQRRLGKQDGFQLEGTLTNAENIPVYLQELTTRDLIPIDTVILILMESLS